MSNPEQNTSQNIIKINPESNSPQTPQCSKDIRLEAFQISNTQEESRRESKKNSLKQALDYCKQLFKVSGDVTLAQLLTLVYQILSVTLSAVIMLAITLVPIAYYIILIIFYAVDSANWVWKEKKIWLAVCKGLAATVSIAILSYIAYYLMASFVLPAVDLLYHIIRKVLSIM